MTGKKQPPIFIVSTGRCGSTLVTLLLKNHPDILSLSEFWPNRVNLKELFSDRALMALTTAVGICPSARTWTS